MTRLADVAHGGSEGEPQADLSHAALYGVRQDAVDADSAEDQREQAEDREQLHVEAVLGERLADEVFQGDYVVDGNVACWPGDGGGDRGGESLWRSRGADHEGKAEDATGAIAEPLTWASRPVERCDSGGAVEAGLLYVADDADDQAISVGEEGEFEMMADGASVGQNWFAMALLMTTTGASRRYRSALMSRPCRSGMCMVWMYPGVIDADGDFGLLGHGEPTGRPSTATGWLEPPARGRSSTPPADSTPGRERTR